ncbi:Hypothetical protein PHPALM_7756 [Phytophthora palmivora]|uniref:Uncharacterized protein n=1 Tax=Phytophthora palmivora TaxID=4796 RepID=A0A2P4YBJ8_9STRA|nr:Hypothetical protein PHPALM_7756 [Phytophthora palmivora]
MISQTFRVVYVLQCLVFAKQRLAHLSHFLAVIVMRAAENVHFCNFTVVKRPTQRSTYQTFTKLYRSKRYFNQSRDEEVNRFLPLHFVEKTPSTIRIIFNNLLFCFGEYEESIIIRELVSKEEFKTAVNARNVTHAMVELYTATRNEMTGCIKDNRVGMFKYLTMVVDFWSSKVQHENYLGIRVYFIDANFRYRSMLLGTRHFSPLYGERDQGIRQPFESGPDVKWMMTNGLGLRWEWCIPHMANASTKMACGQTRKPFNPAMADLLNKMSQTVYDTVSNSTMGDLLPVLMIMLCQGSSTKLVGYKPHRFMGMAATMQRILEK